MALCICACLESLIACVQGLSLDIGPNAAPSLAGTLCVLFNACIAAMARAEGCFKIALRRGGASPFCLCASRKSRWRSARHSSRSSKHGRARL